MKSIQLLLLLNVVMIHGLGFPNMYAQTKSPFTSYPISVNSNKVKQSLQILKEALTLAQSIKDRGKRAQGLIATASVLDNFDSLQATVVLDDALALVSKLRERSPSEDVMVSKVYTQADEKVDLFFVYNPESYTAFETFFVLTKINTLSQSQDTFKSLSSDSIRTEAILKLFELNLATQTIYDVWLKDDLLLQAAVLLSDKDPKRVLTLVQPLKNHFVQVLAIELSLSSWPRDEKDVIISTIRTLAAKAKQDKPSIDLLLALTDAAELYDIVLARELVHKAVETMNKVYKFWASPYIYQILAKLDQKTAKMLLMDWIANPTNNELRLSMFAYGVASVQPELAWLAVKALDKNEKNSG